MLAVRPLRRLTFAQRLAFPGCPVVWCVVFTQEVAPFLTASWKIVFCCSYVIVAAWYGTFRQLKPFDYRQIDSRKTKSHWIVQIGLRCSNTLADMACAVCFLFFMRTIAVIPVVWFPPCFFGAIFFHVATEMEVDRRFRELYADRSFLGGRKPDSRQMEALSALEETKLLHTPQEITIT